MSSSRHVDADDPQVAAILTETVDLVLRHGGSLHPDVVIVERDCDLHLELRSDDTPEQPIVTVPADLLVPLDDLEWTGDDLTLARPPTHLAPATAATLDLMLELYRTCDKVRRFAEVSPRVAAASDAQLADALAATRAGDPSSIGTDPRTAFLRSRVLATKRSDDTPGRTCVLMPIIDVADHDPDGAPFGVGQGDVRLRCSRPTDDLQCLARYGLDRDPLDLAIGYGFTTPRARVVNCIPIAVELASGPVVQIQGRRPDRAGPPSVRRNDDGVSLSHLTFRVDQPGRAASELALPVTSWSLQHGAATRQAQEWSAEVTAQVVAANLAALDELDRAAAHRSDRLGSLLGESVRLCSATLLGIAPS